MKNFSISSNTKLTSSIIITFKVQDFLFYEQYAEILKEFLKSFISKIVKIFSEIVFHYIYLQLKFVSKTNKKNKILSIIFENSDITYYSSSFSNDSFKFFLKTHLTKMENQLLNLLILDIDQDKIYKETGMDTTFITKRIKGIERKIEKFIKIEDYVRRNNASSF